MSTGAKGPPVSTARALGANVCPGRYLIGPVLALIMFMLQPALQRYNGPILVRWFEWKQEQPHRSTSAYTLQWTSHQQEQWKQPKINLCFVFSSVSTLAGLTSRRYSVIGEPWPRQEQPFHSIHCPEVKYIIQLLGPVYHFICAQGYLTGSSVLRGIRQGTYTGKFGLWNDKH